MPTLDEILQAGVAHHQAQRYAQAEQAYRQILAVHPNEPTTLQLLGVLAHHCGQNQAAVELISRAISLLGARAPAEFYNNLGEAYRALAMGGEAMQAYETAIRLNPKMAQPHKNMAIVLAHSGRVTDAIAKCHDALQLAPNDAGIHNNLGNLMLESGKPEQAVAAHRRAIELAPDQPIMHSNLLRDMNFLPDATAEQLAAANREWWIAHGAQPAARAPTVFPNARDPDRRLRVGYVSPDFREHAVAYFFLPILRAHDRAAVEIFSYAEVARPDHFTDAIRAQAKQWRSTNGWNADQFAEQVRADGIDVLIDLAGHTDSNRLTVFTRRPAPVQLSYLGYPLPTGLETIDCRLSDSFVDPPDAPRWGEVCRLGSCAWCFSPSVEEALPIAPRVDGPVTFGSFNFLPKMNDRCVETWSRILQRANASRLALKSRALSDAGVREDVLARFARFGIDASRVEFLERQQSTRDHLLQYGSIDIALDPFPYNGTTTTCEAMWMGVPVVTLAGTLPHARVGVSLLSNAGLPELIACDLDDYVAIASRLAGEPARRRELRKTLRQQMERSPLMDGARAAREIERVIRQRWGAWCGGELRA